MAKFFVAVDQTATKDQIDAFTNYLREKAKIGFWHHISHSWFIVDNSGQETSAGIRGKLCELMPGVTLAVIRAKPDDYAAFSPQSGHEWLTNNILDG